MFEADQLTQRRDLDVVLFLREWPEPAVGPAPETHLVAHDAVGSLQADLSLQEGLGPLVVGKLCCLPVTFGLDVVTLTTQKSVGHFAGIVPADLEIDRGFWEGTVKVAHAEP